MARLKPYVGDNHKDKPKFKVDRSSPIKPTKQDKLEVKNANRSRKKAKRQEARKEIKRKLDLKTKGICPQCEEGILIHTISDDNVEMYCCDNCDEVYTKEEVENG